MALIVALMIVLMVFILTTAMLADAFHNVVGSARSRERLTSVNAAEAGIAWYAHSLESSSLTMLHSSPWTGSGNTFYLATPKTVEGMPGKGDFTVTATYWAAYDAATDTFSGSPCAAPCAFANMQDAQAPTSMWVELKSVGRGGGVSREIRAVLEIRPNHAALQGAFAGIFICELGNRFTITGPSADIYLVGDESPGAGCPDNSLTVTSGQFTTSGSVYVLSGDANLSNTSKIDGSLWAQGKIKLGLGSANGDKTAKPCSSKSSVASVLICGDATSLSTAADAIQVLGTARVLGNASSCLGCTLPTLTFSQITLATAQASFPAPTWSQEPPIAASQASTLFSTASGALAPRLLEISCPSPAGRIVMPKGTLYLRGDLAIVSSCGFEFGGRVEFRKAANVTTTPTLYLMSGYTADICATSANPRVATDSRDIAFTQNFDATAIRLYVYTPCKLIFTNQTSLTGQVVARQLYAQGRTTINTVNLLGVSGGAPGPVTSFSARILSLREV